MRIIKGTTIEEQMASVDTALSQHQRKLSKTVVGIIPPILVFNWCRVLDAEGIVLHQVMPISGSIRTLAIARVAMESKENAISVTVTGSEAGYNYTLVVKRQVEVFDLDYPIIVGDRIKISLLNVAEHQGDVLVALAFMPEISRTERDVQLISALEALEEKLDADESDQEEERPVPSKHTARRKSKRHN